MCPGDSLITTISLMATSFSVYVCGIGVTTSRSVGRMGAMNAGAPFKLTKIIKPKPQ